MKSIAIATLVLALSGVAAAGPTCTNTKEGWKPEADFKKSLTDQGYAIKVFKVTKGNCYEIYGTDKSGKKVEIYFDPVSGNAVKSQ